MTTKLALAVLALALSQAALALSWQWTGYVPSGGTLALPRPWPLYVAVGLQLASAAACLGARRGGRLAPLLCFGLGAATLFISCPFDTALLHALQCVLLLATGALALQAAWRHGRHGVLRAGLPVMILLAVELGFSFVARSHAVGYTLAARAWFDRYWHQVSNTLGYRDVAHADDGRPRLFVVGDSFVAGVGIADVAERFSDRLQALLPDLQVHNLGWNGADTLVERRRLASHPGRPDIVVLSYYVNDIEGAASEFGLLRPGFKPYADLAPGVAALISRSYLLDFLYWRWPRRDLSAHTDYLAACFARPEVVARQREQLEALVAEARSRGARVLGVVFPDLHRPEATAAWVEPALEVFRAQALPCVDVRELVRGHTTAETTVNTNDGHPSAWLHARVAEALALLLEQGATPVHLPARSGDR